MTPKWIGSYETELHECVEEIIAHPYEVIVDVGAAEGSYAIGLARAIPCARIITYDIDFIARMRQRSLARLNGVLKRIVVKGRCVHAALQADVGGRRCVVIADIGGDEVELVDPPKVPGLAAVDVLVECHSTEMLTLDAVTHVLADRFAGTHDIREIRARPRVPGEWRDRVAALRGLSLERVARAVDEDRGPQSWLWMKARGGERGMGTVRRERNATGRVGGRPVGDRRPRGVDG